MDIWMTLSCTYVGVLFLFIINPQMLSMNLK